MIKRLAYSTFLFCLWIGGVPVSTVVWSACVTLTVTYVCIPLLYRTIPAIPRHLIFLNFVHWPWGYDLTHPENHGLEAADNFYLTLPSGVTLGVWHILPKPYSSAAVATVAARRQGVGGGKKKRHDEVFENELRDGRRVVLYLHGNTSCRAQPTRVALYKVLTEEMSCHVVTFDYRGYGDSSWEAPSEAGLVEDAAYVHDYLRALVGPGAGPLLVWGHSLGTGVGCSLLRRLSDEGRIQPDALILEAPFNNIRDEVEEHPLSAVFKSMPWFPWVFLEPLKHAGLHFASDEHLQYVRVPVLILHAEDDSVVPVKLGRRLYDSAVATRPAHFPTVRFISFSSRHGFGHKFIHRSPQLTTIVRQFLEDVSVM